MSGDDVDPAGPFAGFRGQFDLKTLTARRVAGMLDVPGCQRRQVLDAASIDIDKLAVLLGSQPDRQSPYAITRGNQFESRVVEDHSASVISLVREHLGFDIPEIRTLDLSAAAVREKYGLHDSDAVQRARARLTRRAVEQMLTGEDESFNLVRHPLTSLQIGGQTAWLEQDVLAFSHHGDLHVVEIKSFPAIDGQADPDKVSTALRQTAVYLLSMQTLAAELGFHPEAVSTRVLLVLPRNLSFTPVGKVQDVKLQLTRLRRQLDAVPDVAEIVAGLPPEVQLPVHPGTRATSAERAAAREQARNALSAITARFGDGCTACPLFAECRSEAQRRGLIGRLGNDVANYCGAVVTVSDALGLARGRPPDGEAEQALATLLTQAAAAAEFFDQAV